MPANPVPAPEVTQTAEVSGAGHAAIILSLMSQHLRSPCPLLISAIAHRLACLSQACGDGPAEALHRLADALLPQWRNIPLSVCH